jgi:hypothetical protein
MRAERRTGPRARNMALFDAGFPVALAARRSRLARGSPCSRRPRGGVNRAAPPVDLAHLVPRRTVQWLVRRAPVSPRIVIPFLPTRSLLVVREIVIHHRLHAVADRFKVSALIAAKASSTPPGGGSTAFIGGTAVWIEHRGMGSRGGSPVRMEPPTVGSVDQGAASAPVFSVSGAPRDRPLSVNASGRQSLATAAAAPGVSAVGSAAGQTDSRGASREAVRAVRVPASVPAALSGTIRIATASLQFPSLLHSLRPLPAPRQAGQMHATGASVQGRAASWSVPPLGAMVSLPTLFARIHDGPGVLWIRRPLHSTAERGSTRLGVDSRWNPPRRMGDAPFFEASTVIRRLPRVIDAGQLPAPARDSALTPQAALVHVRQRSGASAAPRDGRAEADRVILPTRHTGGDGRGEATAAPSHRPQSNPLDVQGIAEEVFRLFEMRLRIERERRGRLGG